MKVGVVVFPASNCDRDIIVALTRFLEKKPFVFHYKETSLPPLDLIVLPGGFSFGDYLRCGALAARSPIMRDVVAQANRGVAVWGICNGFQILTEAGLLPGALLPNKNLKFMSKLVSLQIESNTTIFTQEFEDKEIIQLPIANHGGSYYAQPKELEELEDNEQVTLRYVEDVNGSLNRIAGLTNKEKRIFGLMPHPERRIENILGGTDGERFFTSLQHAAAMTLYR